MEFYIGVDIGTTGIRAGIYDSELNLVGQGNSRSNIIRGPEDEVYQEPDEIFQETAKAVKEAIKTSGVNPQAIRAISFDGQMAGIMGIDENWNPSFYYDSWLDTRCAEEVQYMRIKAGKKIVEKTGIIPSFNHGPKILWWMNNRPDIYKKTAKFIQPSVYVAGKLAGLKANQAFIDWTYLHFTGFADNRALKWDEKLCKIFNVDLEKFPEIVSPLRAVGYTIKGISEEFGLKKGVVVAAGCGDTSSSLLGAGVMTPDVGADIAGSASVFVLSMDKPLFDYDGMIYSARSVLSNLWYCMSYINGGGLNLEWFRESFAENYSFDDLNNGASNIEPGSDGLIFIPHLNGRAYPPDPEVSGMWSGFSRKHTMSHFYRSMLESVGYEYYLYMDKIRSISGHLRKKWTIRVVGGGGRGKVWNQIKADILGMKYIEIEREDVATLGQAILAAGCSKSDISMVNCAGEKLGIRIEYNPRKEITRSYMRYIRKYKNIIDNFNWII